MLKALGAWRWLSQEQSQSVETEFTLEKQVESYLALYARGR